MGRRVQNRAPGSNEFRRVTRQRSSEAKAEAESTSHVQTRSAAKAAEAAIAQKTKESEKSKMATNDKKNKKTQKVQKNQASSHAPAAPAITKNKNKKRIFFARREEYETKLSVGEWSPIENDAEVLTKLIRELGIKGARMEELWNIKDQDFKSVRPVYGVVFLLKQKPSAPATPRKTYNDTLNQLYVAKQVINNACSTQALLSVLLNVQHPDLELSQELVKFKDYSMKRDPYKRGVALGDSTAIRNAHNTVAERFANELDNKTSAKENVQHRFIAYLPVGDSIYELDGLNDKPCRMAILSPDEDWLEIIRPVIMHKIAMLIGRKIFFNVMALVSSKDEAPCNEDQSMDEASTDSFNIDFRMPHSKAMHEYKILKARMTELEKSRRKYYPQLIALYKLTRKEKRLLAHIGRLESAMKKKAQQRARNVSRE